MSMNPVVHFEMPAEDRKRMADFYTKVFGWKTQHLGQDMGNYVLATTTDSDEKGPKKPGGINGGFFQKTDDKLAHECSRQDDRSTMMMMMTANDNSDNYTRTITTEERLKINVKYIAWLYAKSKEINKQNNNVFDTERAFELVIRDAGGEKAVKELFLKEQDDKIIDELVSLDPTIAETLGQL